MNERKKNMHQTFEEQYEVEKQINSGVSKRAGYKTWNDQM